MKDCKGAVPEVSLRLSRERCIRGTATKASTPLDMVEVMRKITAKDAAQESMVAVYVGPGNEILASQRIALGGIDQTAVDPRVLFSGAILAGATAFVIGHNHPSGSVEPSLADDQLTQALIAGSKVIGVRLLDHLIFSDSDWYSYVSHGRLKFN